MPQLTPQNPFEFLTDQKQQWQQHFHEQGFVVLTDLLKQTDVDELKQAYTKATQNHKLPVALESPPASSLTNDAIYAHPTFQKWACDERICHVVHSLLGRSFELQHSKFNAKPLNDNGSGLIDWHQDYPFFPHTNFDLLAIGIHFDDEAEDSGPIEVIPQSHKWGALSHCTDNHFDYKCTQSFDTTTHTPQKLTGKNGFVTIHHCLTMHRSTAKTNHNKERRVLVLQFRAQDNIQLAGAVWRCTGTHPYPQRDKNKTARFPDQSVVELRGHNGQLYDIYSKFKPSC